jgi:hypothetical protein
MRSRRDRTGQQSEAPYLSDERTAY